ncbi:hypothetical protein FWG76_00440, partial [Candidatus Saccharibacteria bacterium]|nr:hypothetical protein [Candidatus Saccharibacteria bacterium]
LNANTYFFGCVPSETLSSAINFGGWNTDSAAAYSNGVAFPSLGGRSFNASAAGIFSFGQSTAGAIASEIIGHRTILLGY